MNAKQPKLFSERLTDEGSYEMAIASTGFYSLQNTEDRIMCVTRMLFYIQDAPTFDATKWGNGLVLSAGLDLKISQGGVTHTLFENLRTSGELAGLCYDVDLVKFGTGDDVLAARLTFTKLGGPIRLAKGDYIYSTVSDDLSSLSSMYMTMQGYIETERY